MTEPKVVALQVQRNGRRITDARLGRPPNPPRVSFSGARGRAAKCFTTASRLRRR